MDRTPSPRGHSLPASRLSVCLLATAATLVAAVAVPADAGKRAGRSSRLDIDVATPYGLQGSSGAGPQCVLPFRVYERSGRKVTVQVEYGYDRNGDGVIADGSDPELPSEYARATHVRRDPRDSSRIKAGRSGGVAVYRAVRNGATHAFVWGASADLAGARILDGRHVLRDETGRPVRDPYRPGELVFGDPEPGVRLRIRAVSGGARTAWTVTEPFSVDNSSAPSVTIDEIAAVDEVEGRVAVDFTGFDADSEDSNGNGVLDVLGLEDRDGDGQLDVARIAVHLDYARLADGQTVPANDFQMAALAWFPCTRAVGEGDAETGIVVAPAPAGGLARFVWDTRVDLGLGAEAAGRYLIRITPYDESGNVGRPTYLTAPIVIGSGQ